MNTLVLRRVGTSSGGDFYRHRIEGFAPGVECLVMRSADQQRWKVILDGEDALEAQTFATPKEALAAVQTEYDAGRL